MPKFAKLITDGMRARGHSVEVLTAQPWAYKLPAPAKLKKWLGYIDQFIVFPIWMRSRLGKVSSETVFIFTDQALGPWVPVVAKRSHVIHVHDFMALKSARGEFHQNPTSWSGKLYQNMIRRGFNHGKRFISVSKKSQSDLQGFLTAPAEESITIYNGLNFSFRCMSKDEAHAAFSDAGLELPSTGFLLHVGGNQWYKNRIGVLEIYAAYIKNTDTAKPLIMVGANPTKQLTDKANEINKSKKGSVQFIVTPPTEVVCAAYSMAGAFIFPSIAEGFGWPIIEALACGCVVLTTNEAPMTEIGGACATYIPNIDSFETVNTWASECAAILESTLSKKDYVSETARAARIKHALSFDLDKTLDEYEAAYLRAQKAII